MSDDIPEVGSHRDRMADLYGALAKASAEFAPIAKNRTVRIPTKAGGSYNFRYADLEAVIAATRPALSKYGLTLIQPIVHTEGGVRLTTQLVHEGGGALVSSMSLPSPDGKDPKDYGAHITYFRRYGMTAALGVAADDDLDEAPPQGQRSLTAQDMAELLDDIASAKTPGELKLAFDEGVDRATKAGDSDAVKRLTKARDAKLKSAKANAGEKSDAPA